MSLLLYNVWSRVQALGGQWTTSNKQATIRVRHIRSRPDKSHKADLNKGLNPASNVKVHSQHTQHKQKETSLDYPPPQPYTSPRTSRHPSLSFSKMCHVVRHRLMCLRHIFTEVVTCRKSPGPGRACHEATEQDGIVGYPPNPDYGVLPERCPVADCPYETRNRDWQCCRCKKRGNSEARCSSRSVENGRRCPHICCYNCSSMEEVRAADVLMTMAARR